MVEGKQYIIDFQTISLSYIQS